MLFIMSNSWCNNSRGSISRTVIVHSNKVLKNQLNCSKTKTQTFVEKKKRKENQEGLLSGH